MTDAKVLVAGWFSLAGEHATIGDGLALEMVCSAFASAGIPFDICRSGDRNCQEYRTKVWVSGPVDRSYPPQQALLGDGSGWILASTTLITDRLDTGHADIASARDGEGVSTRADFACLSTSPAQGAFAAILLRGLQPEYRTDQFHHDMLRSAVYEAVMLSGMYPVELSTRISGTAPAATLGAGLERVVATAAVTVTSRLHGIIHCLRAGRIPVVVDEVPNGGKVSAFARRFSLPILLTAAECTTERLMEAVHRAGKSDGTEAGSILDNAVASARDNLDRMVLSVAAQLARVT